MAGNCQWIINQCLTVGSIGLWNIGKSGKKSLDQIRIEIAQYDDYAGRMIRVWPFLKSFWFMQHAMNGVQNERSVAALHAGQALQAQQMRRVSRSQ